MTNTFQITIGSEIYSIKENETVEKFSNRIKKLNLKVDNVSVILDNEPLDSDWELHQNEKYEIKLETSVLFIDEETGQYSLAKMDYFSKVINAKTYLANQISNDQQTIEPQNIAILAQNNQIFDNGLFLNQYSILKFRVIKPVTIKFSVNQTEFRKEFQSDITFNQILSFLKEFHFDNIQNPVLAFKMQNSDCIPILNLWFNDPYFLHQNEIADNKLYYIPEEKLNQLSTKQNSTKSSQNKKLIPLKKSPKSMNNSRQTSIKLDKTPLLTPKQQQFPQESTVTIYHFTSIKEKLIEEITEAFEDENLSIVSAYITLKYDAFVQFPSVAQRKKALNMKTICIFGETIRIKSLTASNSNNKPGAFHKSALDPKLSVALFTFKEIVLQIIRDYFDGINVGVEKIEYRNTYFKQSHQSLPNYSQILMELTDSNDKARLIQQKNFQFDNTKLIISGLHHSLSCRPNNSPFENQLTMSTPAAFYSNDSDSDESDSDYDEDDREDSDYDENEIDSDNKFVMLHK